MAKKKTQKKSKSNKLTITAIETKTKTKFNNYKKAAQKNKTKNKTITKTTNKITNKTNKVNNNSNIIKKPNLNKHKISPKSPQKKQPVVNQEKKIQIYDQELENDEIIQEIETKEKKDNEIIEETKTTEQELEKKLDTIIEDKFKDKKIEEKIEEKLSETEEIILPTKNETKKQKSRTIAKKEDVFSKITEWFNNINVQINEKNKKRKITKIQSPNVKKRKNESIIEQKQKKYPKNKFLKALVIMHENLYIPFDTLIILTFIILIVGMNRVQVIPTHTIRYIAYIVGFLSIVAISLNKYISGRIFTIIITAGMLGGIYYLNYTYDFINNLNTKLYEYQEYYVVSLENGRNKTINNINNKKVGLLKDNSRNVKHVLNTRLDRVTYIVYENQDKLYEEFINNYTRAIVVKENQYKYIKNNNIQSDIKVKILYKFNVNTKKRTEE